MPTATVIETRTGTLDVHDLDLDLDLDLQIDVMAPEEVLEAKSFVTAFCHATQFC